MPISRRAFATRAAASLAALGVSPALLSAAEPQSDAGISHTADSIHQERVFKAAPARVYAALTDAREFDGVAKLSDAMKSMGLKGTPSVLGKTTGGAIALFGGYITGLQIELVPNARIVQVWRSASWKAGEYSIVKFGISAQGTGARLTLDHTGFPAGEAQHLADGWKGNYLDPLSKYLA
jgi:activator of HSP90 ATPase